MESEIQLAEAAGIDADDTGEHAEDVVIDVDLSWLNSLEEKLASTRAKSSPSFTICRVPAHIRDSDRAVYSPRIISIGPFHRQSTNLQAMEEHKWRYLDKVLSRSETGNDLGKYLKEMKAKEAQARNCYSENITIGSNEFVEMMVLDGCFILQLIHEQNNNSQIDDPIYRNEWMMALIGYDMLLLENQLPFFVLECLWELIGQSRRSPSLMEEALTFFRPAFPNIIERLLGSDEEVALLFNKLCKEIAWDFEGSYLANMFEEVNQHTQKRWPKWRAKLVHDYFSNPWAIISVIAAIIILIVALVQTFFAVFAYFRPSKP